MGNRAPTRGSRIFTRLGILAVFTVGSFLPVAPLPGAQKQKLENSYKEWLERDVAYFITRDERNAFLKLTSNGERDQFIKNLWVVRSPNPS